MSFSEDFDELLTFLLSAGERTRWMFRAKLRSMDDDAKIVEVSFFGGKVLVTFADGMMALLEPGLIRRLAVEADALKPLPKEPSSSN
jgi:hypothetical protein